MIVLCWRINIFFYMLFRHLTVVKPPHLMAHLCVCMYNWTTAKQPELNLFVIINFTEEYSLAYIYFHYSIWYIVAHVTILFAIFPNGSHSSLIPRPQGCVTAAALLLPMWSQVAESRLRSVHSLPQLKTMLFGKWYLGEYVFRLTIWQFAGRMSVGMSWEGITFCSKAIN